MADEKTPPPSAEQPQYPTIVITLLPTMQVNVAGAIDNKMVAYGMIECAKEAIVAYHKSQENRIIQPAFGMAPGSPFSRS